MRRLTAAAVGAIPGAALLAVAWVRRHRAASLTDARMNGFAAGYEAHARDVDVVSESPLRVVSQRRR